VIKGNGLWVFSFYHHNRNVSVTGAVGAVSAGLLGATLGLTISQNYDYGALTLVTNAILLNAARI